MKRTNRSFSSPLAEEIRLFIEIKRALGRKYANEEVVLRLLDQFLVQHRVKNHRSVSPDVIQAFLSSRPRRPQSYNQLLGIVRLFFDRLVIRGVIDQSPVLANTRRATRCRVPVILEPRHAEQLLKMSAELSDQFGGELRGETYRTVFAVMYALGLRIGEVCRLEIRDIDWHQRLLVIRKSKFGKSRLVPFGPRLGQTLKSYVDARRARRAQLGSASHLFSVSTKGRPLTRQMVGRVFRQFRADLGLTLLEGSSPPRVHDLGHSFAVRTLLRWYRIGMDPSHRLQHLSTFMGHVQPESTAVYLSITPDLLNAASGRFEGFANSILEEGER